MAAFAGGSPFLAGGAVGLQLLLSPAPSSGVLLRCACAVVGVGVPVYSSFKAIESEDETEKEEWLLYWTVYGSLSIVERLTDRILFWFPYYQHAKLLLLIWLQIPNNVGARALYKKFVRPALSRHQEIIDKVLDSTRQELASVMRRHQAELEWIGRMLHKGAAKATKAAEEAIKIILASLREGNRSPPSTGRPSDGG